MPNLRWLFILVFVAVPLAVLVFNIVRTISGKWVEKWQAKVILESFEQSDDGRTLTLHAMMISGEGGLNGVDVETEAGNVFVSFDVVSDVEERETIIEIDLTAGCEAVYFNDRGSSYLMMLRRSEEGSWQDVSRNYVYAERNMLQDNFSERDFEE